LAVSLLDAIRQKAAKDLKTIVLPESDDRRTIDAVNYILEHGIAKLIVIGKDEAKKKITARDQKNLQVIDPETYKDTERFISEYYELRKAKGMTPEESRETMKKDWVIFGAMLVRDGKAAGFVSGACHTTADIIRAALRCISIDKNIGVVSGAFLMELPDAAYGENGVFIFADCGVNPDPNPRQLAGIAVSSAALFEKLVGKKAKVAMLSYSSKGSAEGPMIDKVREALKKARDMAPGLIIDGELQPDSAIVPEVAKIKCPASDVAGHANVLIFPDLNSGNICYKLTQRLANARAVGPLLQGFQKPCSDLSRGCSWEDIVDAVAITSVRA
jgi:phosphate acetyltransferase